MLRSRFRTGLCAALLVVGAGSVLAQGTAAQPAAPSKAAPAESLPDAKEIIARSVEATGGRAAFEKIKTTVTTGWFEVPAQAMKGALKVEQAADKMRVTIDLPGIGQMNMGTDGKTAWASDPMQGPRVLTGPEADAFNRQAARNTDLRLDEFYSSVKTVGVEDVDGKPAYKIELTPKSGKPEHRFYDKESGLLVRTDVTQSTPMGEVKSTTTVSEYRPFGDIKVATLSSTKVMGFEQRITADKVEHNVEIADDRFAPPADVKKLLEQPKDGAAPDPKAPESPK